MRLNFNSKWHTFFLTALFVLYPLAFIWQGGDLTDTGYHATNYFFFFENLMKGETNSLTFLTDFIGASWMMAFPGLGIIGLKLLYLLFLYTSFLFSYKILRPYFPNPNVLLVFLFVGIVFSTRYTMFVFSHDIASWTFLILSLYFFTSASPSFKNFLLSGMFIGLAIFARFSDLTILFLLPFLWGLGQVLKVPSFQNSRQRIQGLASGLLLIVLIFGLVLGLNGLLKTYVHNLGFFHFSVRPDAANSYSALILLKSYLIEFIQFVPHVLFTFLGFILLSTTYKKANPWIFLLVFTTLFVVICQYYFGFSYASKFRFLVPAFCLITLLHMIQTKDQHARLGLVILAYTLAQMLGTNTGLLLKMNFGISLLIPLCFLFLHQHTSINFKKLSLATKPILLLAFVVFVGLGFTARIGFIYNVDFGYTCRLRAVEAAPHVKMKHLYTTFFQAKEINRFKKIIDQNVPKGDPLFIYGHKPMFYYLMENPPAIKEYWLGNNVYTVKQIFDALEASPSRHGKWPIIIDTNQPLLGKDGEEALADFLSKHHYEAVIYQKDLRLWRKATAAKK